MLKPPNKIARFLSKTYSCYLCTRQFIHVLNYRAPPQGQENPTNWMVGWLVGWFGYKLKGSNILLHIKV